MWPINLESSIISNMYIKGFKSLLLYKHEREAHKAGEKLRKLVSRKINRKCFKKQEAVTTGAAAGWTPRRERPVPLCDPDKGNT